MPSPSSSLSTLRPDLGGSVEEFDLAADRAGFIGLKVMPVFESGVQAGSFGRIPLKQLLETRETNRAPGASYARSGFKFEPVTFATVENGAEEPVDDREARMYSDYFDAEMVATERARDVVLRNHEIRVAATVFDATTFASQTNAVTNEWDDASNATPIDDVKAACIRMWERCGLWPNAIVFNRKVFLNVRDTDQIIDRVKYAERVLPADIGVSQLQAAWDLPYIFVAGSPKNTANKGQAVNIDPIWSDEYAAVLRICTRPRDIREPGFGRTLHWGEDGSQIGTLIESYRDETTRSNIIRARMDTQEKVIYTAAIELLSNITT